MQNFKLTVTEKINRIKGYMKHKKQLFTNLVPTEINSVKVNGLIYISALLKTAIVKSM